jgi:hypothetical protein
LGEADVILNIKLIKGENEIILKQSHYVENILKRFGYLDSKASPTPYDPSLKLRKNRGQGINLLLYSQIICSLMYLAGATRLDISFAVNKLSRFTSNPGSDHGCSLERVMRYLRGTFTYGLHYTGYLAILQGYSDSNWISDADEIKATSGYIFTIGGAAVSWRSTMEAKLVALESATTEAEWLKELLMDLPMVAKPVSTNLLHCDNQSLITIVGNAKFSRHVKRRIKSVRHLRNTGEIVVEYINTTRNLAVPFTKGLAHAVIDETLREMGLKPT